MSTLIPTSPLAAHTFLSSSPPAFPPRSTTRSSVTLNASSRRDSCPRASTTTLTYAELATGQLERNTFRCRRPRRPLSSSGGRVTERIWRGLIDGDLQGGALGVGGKCGREAIPDVRIPRGVSESASASRAPRESPRGVQDEPGALWMSALQPETLQRVSIWLGVLVVLLQLHEFTGIMMGTLVLSVVGNAVVEALQRAVPGRRRLLVAGMYSVTLAVVVGLAVMRLPGAYQDGMDFLLQLQGKDPYLAVSSSLRNNFGDAVTEQVESFLLLAASKPDAALSGFSAARGSTPLQRSQAVQQLLKRYSGQLLSLLATSVAATSRFVLQSVVSLILSCMIVWDLPALSASIRRLSTSRMAAVYNEIAPAAVTFGRIFQRALEAQSAIAVANTLLTLLGLLLLRVGRVVALSLIVFVCSFVPVAGVIISTVPIGLVALYEGGAVKVLLVVLMVVLIHAVEAYILNPVIYSAHLKLHPILTLAVLVVSEHVFGVWGLITAVPLAVFFVDYIIYNKPQTEATLSAQMIPAPQIG